MTIVSDEARRRKSEYNKAYRAANLTRIAKSQRTYREARKKSDPTYASNRALVNKYGITIEQRSDMLSAQGFRCAICRTDTPGSSVGQWHVDHCHSSERVRGLLCHACNVGLGHFKDSPDALRAAAEYLERNTSDTR